MTANQINYWALQETKRNNLVRERETERSNKENEAIKRYTAKAGAVNQGISSFGSLAKGVASIAGLFV